jgi:threonine/homoserine/homoserine lactone efflux protein
MKDDIKTVCVGVGGLLAQFAAIELVLKVAVGVATLVYLLLRIWKLLKGKDEEE